MLPEERLRKKLKERLSKSYELAAVVVAMKEKEVIGVVTATTGEEADMVVIDVAMTTLVATKDLRETIDVHSEWEVIDEVALDITDELKNKLRELSTPIAKLKYNSGIVSCYL